MKHCKYCNRNNENSAEICAYCGGSDFAHVCDNCGTKFDTGMYCPHCGVRAGKSAKVCRKCGEVYFSRACPSCGYIPVNQEGTVITDNYSAPIQQRQPVQQKQTTTKKKDKTWVTVLLWIFFLPIMAIIAIWKAKKLSKKTKIILTAVCVVFMIIVAATENSTDTENEPEKEDPLQTITPIFASHTPNESNPPIFLVTPAPEPTLAPTLAPAPEPEEIAVPTAHETGYVDANELNLRAEPDGEIIGKFEGGEPLEIIDESGDWYHVNIGGLTGYMAKEYVGKGESEEAQETGPEPEPKPEPEPELDGPIVYWTPEGEKYHSSSGCMTLAKSDTVHSGTKSEAARSGKTDACGICYN